MLLFDAVPASKNGMQSWYTETYNSANCKQQERGRGWGTRPGGVGGGGIGFGAGGGGGLLKTR